MIEFEYPTIEDIVEQMEYFRMVDYYLGKSEIFKKSRIKMDFSRFN